MAHGADSVKSILYALVANAAIAVAKFTVAMITGSGAMLAESIHSVADTGNQGLLLFGLKRSKRPPSESHPLGAGKTIYFWSFIVALMLFSVGGLFSIYEGLHKLRHPEPLNHVWLAVGVLVFAVVAEALSLAGCTREINKVRAGRSYWQWFRETRQGELLVVFGEDLAALLGLVFALAAILLTLFTGNPAFDAMGSVMIGVLLIVVAIFISIEVKQLLIGQGVEPRQRDDMLRFLEAREEVAEIYNLVTLQMGSDVMVAVKARMSEERDAGVLIDAVNRTEAAFRQAFPAVAWLFFEPDNRS